ncbi:hypothetical protein ABZ769_29530 [Streptomyces olivoreticuli]
MTALGWASGRSGVLGPHAQPVLGRFAFTFAMPALLFLTPLIMVLIDLDVHRGVRGQWRRFARLPLRNPVIGVAIAALGWRLPAEVVQPIRTVGGAGVPAALFALVRARRARAVRRGALRRAADGAERLYSRQ